MLPFKVRRFNARSGEEIVILTRRSGEPFFYPTVFATGEYRNARKSPNTIARVLRSIGMALMWAEINGRDLDSGLSQGAFISVYDARDLASFLGLVAAEQEALYDARALASRSTRSKVVGLEALRPHPRILNAPRQSSVSDEELGARLRWVAKYAEWHLERRLHAMEVNGRTTEPFKTNAESAIKKLKDAAPSVSDFVDDNQALEAPDLEVIVLIEQMLDPGSPNNPFSTDFIKWRNYVAWRLLLDTGARRHEVHGARVGDVEFAIRRLRIPKSKSQARTVAIRSKTAEAFDHYVMTYWTELPAKSEARQKGYLFCRENGRHLSLRAINRIFETVRDKLDDRPQNITPHTMRRVWNHLFSRQIDSTPPEERISGEQEARIRMRIMGWSTDAQAKRYNRRHIREAGDKISQAMMDQLDEHRVAPLNRFHK